MRIKIAIFYRVYSGDALVLTTARIDPNDAIALDRASSPLNALRDDGYTVKKFNVYVRR